MLVLLVEDNRQLAAHIVEYLDSGDRIPGTVYLIQPTFRRRSPITYDTLSRNIK